MCAGGSKGGSSQPAWKTASPSDTANRGNAQPQNPDPAKRIAATSATPGSTLGTSSNAPVTSSVLGG